MPCGGGAVDVGHAQVEEHDVRLELGRELDRLAPILRFSDELEFGSAGEQFAYPAADDIVIFGHEHTGALHKRAY